jgi:hypothetical protein
MVAAHSLGTKKTKEAEKVLHLNKAKAPIEENV